MSLPRHSHFRGQLATLFAWFRELTPYIALERTMIAPRPARSAFASVLFSAILAFGLDVNPVHAEVPMPLLNPAVAQAWQMAEDGDFAGAEAKLTALLDDPNAPVTSGAAIALEQLRRIKLDYNLTPEAMLNKLLGRIKDVTAEDLERWRQAGEVQYRMIDGQVRYFGREPGNLFRFCEEAKARRIQSVGPAGKFNLAQHAKYLLAHARSDTPYIFPVRYKVTYSMWVPADHPRVKPGAKLAVWMPFPQEHEQQRNVRLISFTPEADPANPGEYPLIATSSSPHRTLYFETSVPESGELPRFRAEFEFTTYAKVLNPDPQQVKPYDENSDIYREYTAERPPHIMLDAQTRQLAAKIVGDETNPLLKARHIFHWVDEHVRYCSEVEYSTIQNIAAKALSTGQGDCGVQSLTFITLCRAAGIPARWQSGFQMFPDSWNLHDWSEFYVEPYGWLPCDQSYGVLNDPDPKVQDFLCGNMDPFRWIVNTDYGRDFVPPKTSFRSEPTDFQRGEIEIDGHNLFFNEWKWDMSVEQLPLTSDYHALEVALDDRVPGLLEQGKVPGAVIQVGRQTPDGFDTWTKAYGYRSLVPERTPMTADLVFDMASLTKPLATGLVLRHLAEEGLLKLEDPVSKYLPEFKEGDKAKAKIAHLVTHRAGLPPYLGGQEQAKLREKYGDPCPDATRERIRNITLATEPGTTRRYSCLSAILSEEVIQTITGKPFDEVFDEVIAQPLGRDTLGFNRKLPPERFAPTQPATRAGLVHDPLAALQGGVSGNAGLFGTADDVAAIAQMLLSHGRHHGTQVLSEEAVASIVERPPNAFSWKSDGGDGNAWLWYHMHEQPMGKGLVRYHSIGHTGYTGTMLRIYPDLGLYVIVLTNRVHPDDSGKVQALRNDVLETVGDVLYERP